MPYLIDTDICSAHLRNVQGVTSRFLQHSGQLSISVLTFGELLSWTLRSKSPAKYQQALLNLIADVNLLDVDRTVAQRFGEIRARLLDQGTTIASIDLMIAATALEHGLTVVTHNVQHFAKVPGLIVEDWLSP